VVIKHIAAPAVEETEDLPQETAERPGPMSRM
jgi:hypothetical protein